MVLNAAVQMLREADELKLKISKFKSGTSMLQERSLWATQQQLQKIYQRVLVLDLDYALDKKVEQDLWNIGFKQQIEALQAISKDRKNPQRSEGQAMLSWVLQAAGGFYLCLLHQICTTFKLDLPFRRRASLLGWVEGWGAGEGSAGVRLPPPAAARYICQHCLVHLGDLARYRQQLRVAHTFYRHALAVSAHSGQPYNQLALVAWRRGRRLGAVYWHVRSLLVRAPFPPAPANLARTLRAATFDRDAVLPVLPGVTDAASAADAATQRPARLDAHSYVTELLRAIHLIHNLEDLEKAAVLVNSLNSSLSALIATDSFESMTLIKMACVLIWLVHSTTEDMAVDSAVTECEAAGAALASSLAAAMLLALLLPQYSLEYPSRRVLPAVKVWLQWLVDGDGAGSGVGSGVGMGVGWGGAAWVSRPALWAALAHTLNALANGDPLEGDCYDRVPLSEDEELLGFVPLERGHVGLHFPAQASAPAPADDDVSENDILAPSDTAWARLGLQPELEHRVRARRLVGLARRLADRAPDHLSYTEEDNRIKFTAASVGGEQLSIALAELAQAGGPGGPEGPGGGDAGPLGGDGGDEDDSDDEPKCMKPPNVISEADFREKVREKRAGILKPQGSLERAREERALASTQDELEPESLEESKADLKESRKPRVNIAMAAIMRKQEETNKQVKFVTPPPTPDSTADSTESKDDKPKVIQPKAIKSLANLPVGRKTGGILSLKDKSAGYPHLVNIEPEPTKKVEKEEKKDPTPSQASQNSQQTYQPKRPEHQPSPNWGPTIPPQNPYAEPPRMNFQKPYGIQNTGISYNPNYQPNVNNQGIRLPVVNPKEIDVRTAALQKQNSRQDMFQEAPKFGNQGYQLSGDKKNFLNDLPPRFANQYRYWQNAQENQFNDNKFRDDKSNSLFNPPPRPWLGNPQMPEYQQQMPWWKPENPPNFNAPYTPINVQPNYFTPNPYQNVSGYNPMQNQSMGQKPENVVNQPNYLQSTIGQPQMQNIVPPPNFNSLPNFTYPPAVGYDSSMYPQFGKLGYPPMQMKPQVSNVGFQKEGHDMGGLNFAPNARDMQHRNVNFEPSNDMAAMKNMDQMGSEGASEAGNTYSLFSGAPDNSAWGAAPRHPHQSLWSGPGPSPLERLLEQQKQMKQPAPQ